MTADGDRVLSSSVLSPRWWVLEKYLLHALEYWVTVHLCLIYSRYSKNICCEKQVVFICREMNCVDEVTFSHTLFKLMLLGAFVTHSYPIAHATPVLVRNRDKMNRICSSWSLRVLFQGVLCHVFVLKLPLCSKPKQNEYIPQSIKYAEFDALCFLLLVLLFSDFYFPLNQVFILSNLHKIFNFEIAFFKELYR